ncbi:hypothetical protein JHK82_041366 [Glycine max]|nr:hypothetical protein JHK86_041425 [Glycine max]KAG4955653.1 hypothetical protein JHK85_042033 [Glycine max]KAG5104396.1 hypothetical protein JHK82_041366 [Glycine max]KAG5115520.1 hypothetical protein JHK84_041633 [Glycine max]
MLRHLSVHAPRLALNYSTRLVHRGSRQSLMTRAFSSSAAAVSPPSKAIVYEAHGDEVGGGSTGGSERKRRMLAAPINPSDINRIQGVYPVRPDPPAVGGYEGVGEVHSVGSSVTSLSPGDWVISSPPSFGTWLTYIVKDEKVWHKIEKGVPMEYAATITVNPLTALLMLEHCVALNSGDAIVQNGRPAWLASVSFRLQNRDLSLRGFWLQKWLSTDKAQESRGMIDF